MYGTIARIQAKPGMKDALLENFHEQTRRKVPGLVASYLYQMDKGSNEYYMAVLFKDKTTYDANADDPAQDAQYRKLLKLLVGEPEWHDGEIIAQMDLRA